MNSSKNMCCWDNFRCPQEDKEQCPAYLKRDLNGHKCWAVAADNTKIVNSGVNVVDGTKACWDCDYFKLRMKEKA